MSSSPLAFAQMALPFAASYLSTYLVRASYNFTDHTFHLAAESLAVYGIVSALIMGLKHYYESDDGKIDNIEATYLILGQFLLWVLGVMLPQYAFTFLSDAATAWVLPTWYEFVAIACVLLLFVVVFSEFVKETLEVTSIPAAVTNGVIAGSQ